MMKRIFLPLLLSLIPVLLWGRRIEVRNQADFDQLQHSVDAVLSSKDTLADIRIAPGIYYFREGHLRLSDLDRGNFHLRIYGQGAVLTAMSTGHGYDLDNGYVDLEKREPVDIREHVAKAGSWPIPVFFRRNVFMIRCEEPDRDEDEVEGWHIILSQWFKGAVYPVEKIHRGWLYFRKDRDYGTWMWSELRFGRCLPRYILCHPPVREDLHPCGVSNFLTVQDSRLGSVDLEGLTFLGNRAGKSLLQFDRVDAGRIRISNSRFLGMRSESISTEETDRFQVKECVFRNNYMSCIHIGEGGSDVSVLNNRFLDNGLMMSNAAVVRCMANDYRIAENYFEDFSYSAVSVGIHYTKPDRFGTSGVVEKNEICMSEAFRRGVPRALIDAGAIYIGTINERVVIRDNHIHDILGPHGNRGILADDGAVNVEIAGNRIFHIWSGYCIDLRRCYRVARRSNSKISRTNVGNKVHDNVCDGKMRLFVRKDDPGSFLSNNQIVHGL